MLARGYSDLNLYGSAGNRKYLNASERQRFARAAHGAPPEVELFCLTLCLSGARISEILALTPSAIDLDSCVASITTLKRRKPGIVRQVPLPCYLVRKLDRIFGLRQRQHDPSQAFRRIWTWSRTTAWRRVKEVMAKADIIGLPATPKGLRHGFGVSAFQSLVPPHLVQRWLGHASLKTTSIYGDVMGADERFFAERMWRQSMRFWSTRNDFGLVRSWISKWSIAQNLAWPTIALTSVMFIFATGRRGFTNFKQRLVKDAKLQR